MNFHRVTLSVKTFRATSNQHFRFLSRFWVHLLIFCQSDISNKHRYKSDINDISSVNKIHINGSQHPVYSLLVLHDIVFYTIISCLSATHNKTIYEKRDKYCVCNVVFWWWMNGWLTQCVMGKTKQRKRQITSMCAFLRMFHSFRLSQKIDLWMSLS